MHIMYVSICNLSVLSKLVVYYVRYKYSNINIYIIEQENRYYLPLF